MKRGEAAIFRSPEKLSSIFPEERKIALKFIWTWILKKKFPHLVFKWASDGLGLIGSLWQRHSSIAWLNFF